MGFLSRGRRHAGVALMMVFCVLMGVGVDGQDDVLVRARELAVAGNRAEAITMLRASLTQVPGNTDAHVLLGTVLSWDGRYDEARQELGTVLAQNPTHGDALLAMANVELWSNQRRRAEALDVQARETRGSPQNPFRWQVRAGSSYERFSDRRVAWQESHVSVSRATPVGPVIVTGARAKRFGLSDTQVEIEMYPKLARGTYAYVTVAHAASPVLYPNYRVGADLNQSLGAGFEGAVGFRRLAFGRGVYVYSGSLSKYHGRWLLMGRVSLTPESGRTSRSYLGSVRRYVGDSGTHLGARYGQGARQNGLRDRHDLEVLDSHVVSAEATIVMRARVELNVSGSYSREDRVEQRDMRQFSLFSGLGFRF